MPGDKTGNFIGIKAGVMEVDRLDCESQYFSGFLVLTKLPWSSLRLGFLIGNLGTAMWLLWRFKEAMSLKALCTTEFGLSRCLLNHNGPISCFPLIWSLMTFSSCLFNPFIPFYPGCDELGVYICSPTNLNILERGLITDSILDSQYTGAMLHTEWINK